jgi:phage terminase large subunit-like protein
LGRVSPETAVSAVQVGALRLRLRDAHAAANPWNPMPHQLPPEGDGWAGWVLMGGRGAGKTDAGAHATNEHAMSEACLKGGVPHRIGIVSTTHDDCVDIAVRGESGLLQANPRIRFRPGSSLYADLTWPNGAEGSLFGTFTPEDVERFRGPQYCFLWADEIAAWRKLDEAWDQIEFGLRLGPHPRWIATTTPKRRSRFKDLMAQPDVVVSHAKTMDNPHLDLRRRAKLYEKYGSTTLGRQELDAEMLGDLPGALWRRVMIDYSRIDKQPDHLRRIVVAIDPAATSGEDSDETGIVVVGVDDRRPAHGYVLADLSGRYAPIDWARVAVNAYRGFGADRVVGEVNNGGEMIEQTLRTVDPNVAYQAVRATRGKLTRAEPIAALYEQGRIHHVGSFPELEDQQCTWLPGAPDSPDRMDAMVWGFTETMVADENPWAGMESVGGVA